MDLEAALAEELHSLLSPGAPQVARGPGGASSHALAGPVRGPTHGFLLGTPFVGLDGPGEAVRDRKWILLQNNCYEKAPFLSEYLKDKFGPSWEPKDIMHVGLDEWEDSHVLMSGPPCQHNTFIGARGGLFDADRSDPFFRLLEAAQELDRRGKLLVLCIENSPAILMPYKGPNYFMALQSWWSERMPHWTPLEVWRLDANQCGRPLNRNRVFLLACPKRFAEICMSQKLQQEAELCHATPFMRPTPEAPVRLEDFVDGSLPGFAFDDMTDKMQQNAFAWRDIFEKKLVAQREAGERVSQVGTVDLSRCPTNTFKAYITMDACMSLTTKNCYLAMFGASGSSVPLEGRFLSPKERAGIMGFKYESIERYFSPRQLNVAIGNAICVPVARKVLDSIVAELTVFDDWISRLRAPMLSIFDNASDTESDKEDSVGSKKQSDTESDLEEGVEREFAARAVYPAGVPRPALRISF